MGVEFERERIMNMKGNMIFGLERGKKKGVGMVEKVGMGMGVMFGREGMEFRRG